MSAVGAVEQARDLAEQIITGDLSFPEAVVLLCRAVKGRLSPNEVADLVFLWLDFKLLKTEGCGILAASPDLKDLDARLDKFYD
jgi:hypothetical protein